VWLALARSWWWKRGYRKLYAAAQDTPNPYALNAGTAERFCRLVDELRSVLHPRDEELVLDLGGGNGVLSHHVFGHCRRLVVMDFHHPALRGNGGLNTRWVVGDMNRPPFKAESFTLLFTYSTLPHAATEGSSARMIEAWDALLAPGGVLFIGDIPDRRAIPRILAAALPRLLTIRGIKFYFAILMQSFYSRRKLVRELERLGYRAGIVEQAPVRRFADTRFDVLAVKGPAA
jgi:SAM-dependent methyltransferase